MRRFFALTALALVLPTAAQAGGIGAQSPAFADGARIPDRHVACALDGQATANVSPELIVTGVHPRAESLAIAVTDPDVPADRENLAADSPRRTIIHWLVADIPLEGLAVGPGGAGVVIPEGFAGGVPGANQRGEPRYMGPCPPPADQRLHRYVFDIYAIPKPSLGLKPGFTQAEMVAAIDGETVGAARLIGTYSRNLAVK